jgi:RNA polymerase sigma factor (sigma-70 family)
MTDMSSSATLTAPRRGLAAHLTLVGDERLARRAGGGDAKAYAAVYDRYHQPLYRYCRSILGNEQDAQDALQSTFAVALSALRDGKRNAPLRPWLFRIAHNESISIVRRRRATDSCELESVLPAAASAEDVMWQRARFEQLIRDLEELPEEQRAALTMRELNGLSYDDIAIALDTSPVAARQKICAARRSLLELEEGRTMTCESVQETISRSDRRLLRGRRVRTHLRNCDSCAAFAAAIDARQTDLKAFTPLLPAAAAVAFREQLFGASLAGHAAVSASVGGSAGAVATAGVGAAGGSISKLLATAGFAKLLAGTAVIAGLGVTAAGTTLLHGDHASAGHRGRVVSHHTRSGIHPAAAHHRAPAGAGRQTPAAVARPRPHRQTRAAPTRHLSRARNNHQTLPAHSHRSTTPPGQLSAHRGSAVKVHAGPNAHANAHAFTNSHAGSKAHAVKVHAGPNVHANAHAITNSHAGSKAHAVKVHAGPNVHANAHAITNSHAGSKAHAVKAHAVKSHAGPAAHAKAKPHHAPKTHTTPAVQRHSRAAPAAHAKAKPHHAPKTHTTPAVQRTTLAAPTRTHRSTSAPAAAGVSHPHAAPVSTNATQGGTTPLPPTSTSAASAPAPVPGATTGTPTTPGNGVPGPPPNAVANGHGATGSSAAHSGH